MFRRSKKKQPDARERAKSTLTSLKKRESHFSSVVEGLNAKLLEMYQTLQKEKERYDVSLAEALAAVEGYSKEVDKLKIELQVAQTAIEAIDASNNKLREKWRADTAIEIQRRKLAEGDKP